MLALLKTIIICGTFIYICNKICKYSIHFTFHNIYENKQPESAPLTQEEQKVIEDQKNVMDGMNEVIKFTQEFLGGETDAESESETKQ
jgi:hypothetical protein